MSELLSNSSQYRKNKLWQLRSCTAVNLWLVSRKADEVEAPGWASLPDEILTLIQSNLHLINDFNLFRTVCKAWKSAAYPDDHIGFGSQLLLYKRRDQSFVTFHHPLARYPYCMDLPELRDASILCSRDGWLLISRDYALFFFNPFSKSVIKWPNLPCTYDKLKGVTFTSSPTSEDCSVIALAILGNGDVVSMVTASRRHEFWSVLRFDDTNPRMFSSYGNPIYHHGKLWFLCNFNVAEQTFQFSKPYDEGYVLDFNGEVAYVFVTQMGGTILIFTWDNALMEWRVIDDLGEYTFFLSKTVSFARKSARDCMKNKIYFVRFHGEYGVFYSLEDRSYHTFGDNFSSREFNDTVQPSDLECCWIEPNSGSS